MKLQNIVLIAVLGIFLESCTSQTSPIISQTSSSAQNEVPTAMSHLMSISLPDGWNRIESKENHIVSYGNDMLKDDIGTTDYFMAQVLPEVCDEAFAWDQVKMNWGDTVPSPYKPTVYKIQNIPVGYTWSAFDGMAGGETVPRYIHWCIHQPQVGMDINISATRGNEEIKRFIQETFIPTWLKQTTN